MDHPIEVHWQPEAGEAPLTDDEVRRAALVALNHGGRSGIGLEIVFTSDRTLAEMHGRYLGDPSETDVMAFDLGEETPGPAGELYVSVDRARARAEARDVRVERELSLYVVHGCLHLCGFDDHDAGERAAMRAAENEVMSRLGFEVDDAPHEFGA